MANFGQVSDHISYGFEVARHAELNPRYCCVFCSLIINDPIQLTECGHRSCLACFESRESRSTDGNVICPADDCHLTANRSNIMKDKAFRKELDALVVTCKYKTETDCNWTGQLKDYQKHLDENHTHHKCQTCGDEFSTRLALEEHMRQCPGIYSRCSFGKYCTEEMILKEEFHSHVLSEKHQEALNKFLLGEYHISESTAGTELDEQFENETVSKLGDLSHKIQELENQIVENHRTFENLSKATKILTDDLRSIYLNKNEKNSMKQTFQTTQNQLQKEIEELDELVNTSQYVPMDGFLTWRIDNVAEKMADAQSERQTSIYSPVFYSSPTGYKMRARLFLFGDGNARRTHISLFFLLMKGDYDSILKWPFHYKVIFCLLDQTGNNRHIIDSFYPDVKSNSFQRPRENQNTASGIPKFFPLPMLLQDDNSYVRENTMYLKIMIALNETPKSILPFMLTLNPALPNYVQENLISQEQARQQANMSTN